MLRIWTRIWMYRNFSLTDQIQFSAANWQERVHSRNCTFVFSRNGGIERKLMLRLFMLDVYVYGQLHETVEITVANS